MTQTKVIRYRTHADENERLIRAVFAELAQERPDGLHYMTLRLDDGVSFVHVAVLDGADNPLTASAAFAAFPSGIKDRCTEGPAAADATVRFLPAAPAVTTPVDRRSTGPGGSSRTRGGPGGHPPHVVSPGWVSTLR
jgi:hypothetical protein